MRWNIKSGQLICSVHHSSNLPGLGRILKAKCTLGSLVGPIRAPYVIHLGPSKLARGRIHIKVFDTLQNGKIWCMRHKWSYGAHLGALPTIRRCTGESQAPCGAVQFFFKTVQKQPVDTWVWCDWRLNYSHESKKNCKYKTGKGTETKHNRYSTRCEYLFHCN